MAGEKDSDQSNYLALSSFFCHTIFLSSLFFVLTLFCPHSFLSSLFFVFSVSAASCEQSKLANNHPAHTGRSPTKKREHMIPQMPVVVLNHFLGQKNGGTKRSGQLTRPTELSSFFCRHIFLSAHFYVNTAFLNSRTSLTTIRLTPDARLRRGAKHMVKRFRWLF